MKLLRLASASLLFIFLVILSPRFVIANPLDNWHWRNPLPQGNTLKGVTYGNGTFVAVGESGTLLTSSDGINWIERNSGITTKLYEVTYGNGMFVAVGSTILTSSDGIIWTDRSSGTNEFPELYVLYEVTYGNGTFVAVGGEFYASYYVIPNQNIILTSSDGVNWVVRRPGPYIERPPYEFIYGITYGNDAFVAVGQSGMILASSDGINWTDRSPRTTNDLFGVTYGNGTFIAYLHCRRSGWYNLTI